MSNPDIMADPTAELECALRPDMQPHVSLGFFMRLHRHILAGGALPAQWRGEGTAAGKLVKDAEENISVFENVAEDGGPELPLWLENADMTREAVKAVTGKG